ncbi:hypothetical protein FOZ63_001267 [Perkinsus olseni]|uniref:Uncharacterized protein n=3 Tax=Perkinsus olseni TaxID=32597 RepID=A0A7J6S4N7_PEROL|nr:hypothetical protein FOZ63_001267 [Perkinsus olseni]
MAFEAEVSPIERKLALLALQKRDSSIKSILTHAPHAVLFHLNHFPASGDPTPTWEKLDIEGVLYLVSTITGQFRLILFDNEQAPSGAGLEYTGASQRDMWMADLSHDVVAEQHGHTLHLRTANNEVFALWMARPEVADRVCSYVGSILSARPLPSPPSPSDLLKMILARRPTSGPQEAPAASSSPSESVDAADSVQGSEGKQGPSSTSVPSVEGSNSSATFSSNSSNMAAGQHILSLLKGGKTDAPVESPGSSRASSNSGQPASSPAESVASGEGGLASAAPNPQEATTVDTFEMLQAELSKPNDDDDTSVSGRPREEEDDDGTAPNAVEGISVTKDTLRQALVDVVSSDEFMEMLTQRLRQI